MAVLSAGAIGAATAVQPIAADRVAGIYIGSQTGAMARSCAATLQQGWKQLYGTNLALLDAQALAEVGAKVLIVVGPQAALEQKLLERKELDAVKPGGHLIKCGDGRIVIAGPDAFSTQFGVSAFLERLGLKSYGGKAALKKPAGPAMIAPFRVSDRPFFFIRAGAIAFADPRKGLNPELYDKDSDQWIDHSAGYLIPKKLYYDKHPEYYAMLENGRRISRDAFTDHRTPLCFSNPDVTRIAIERALGWVKLQPDAEIFMITNGDGGWCACPECNTLDHAPAQHAGRLLHWANPIARAVGEKYPDVVCMTFAYGGSDQPPPGAMVESNLWICGATGLGNVEFWAHCMADPERKKAATAKVESWLKIVPRQFVVCEYQSGTYKPAPVDSLVDRLRWYKEKGLRGILFTYGSPDNFRQLWDYLRNRLLWDPGQDADKLAGEFIENYYGPASQPVKDYIALTRAQYQKTIGRAMEGGYPAGFYEDGYTAKCLACFKDAGARADKQLQAEIYAEERMFLMDWMQHPLTNALNEQSKRCISRQLDRLYELACAGDTNAAAKAAGEIYATGVKMEALQPGAREFVEQWLSAKNVPRPSARQAGHSVVIPPAMFMYAGYGPRKYGELIVPKMAVGVYVEGNTAGRSSKMEADFELTAEPGPGEALLEIEGQDCDHDVPAAAIRIEINGRKIFEGQVLVVKHNWSRQSFKFDRAVLKKGPNRLVVRNATDPASIKNWYERWFMLCNAEIKLENK